MKKRGYKGIRLIISGVLMFQALIMCLLSVCDYFFSKTMDSYIEVPAYITDVRTFSGGRGSGTKYYYTLVYTYNGQEHERKVRSSFSPDEDLSHIWLEPETGKYTEGSKEDHVKCSLVFGAMAIIALLASIISFVVITISEKKKLQRMQTGVSYDNYLQRDFTGNVY